MKVHKKIKFLRQSKGLTQEEVAEKRNMSVSGYGDIERGDSDLKLSKLEKITNLFGISVKDLFDLNEKGILNLTYKQNGSKYPIISFTEFLTTGCQALPDTASKACIPKHP